VNIAQRRTEKDQDPAAMFTMFTMFTAMLAAGRAG